MIDDVVELDLDAAEEVTGGALAGAFSGASVSADAGDPDICPPYKPVPWHRVDVSLSAAEKTISVTATHA
jgi:hypothetical protein